MLTAPPVGLAPPPRIVPMVACRIARPPAGRQWLHEPRLSGERGLIRLDGGAPRLVDGDGHDLSARYPALVAAARRLAARSLVLDGIVAIADPAGVTSRARLARDHAAHPERVRFYAFDVIWQHGADLRGWPLRLRRAALATLLAARPMRAPVPEPIVEVPCVPGDGTACLEAAAALGLAGIVSKLAASCYVGGPARTWLETPTDAPPGARRRAAA